MNNHPNFVNPYNFVPLEGKCLRYAPMLGDLTGVIECTLTTLSPLFIPDTESKEERNDIPSYKFFSYDGQTPVIPGSSIRGVVRGVYEAAFNGCLSALSSEHHLARRLNRIYMNNEVHSKKIESLLDNNGKYAPCENRKELCSACMLFGMVPRDDTGKAQGSRVRFGDAELAPVPQDGLFQPAGELKPLGVPKPSAVEFYTEPPQGFNVKPHYFWTYDHYRTDKNIQIDLSSKKPKPRGRKFYWHGKTQPLLHGNTNDTSINMIRTIRPLSQDVTFALKVYFENITTVELARLCWALDFGDSAKNSDCPDLHVHKLGQAKPFGYGSARIIINKISCRSIDADTGLVAHRIIWPKPTLNSQIKPRKMELDLPNALEQKRVILKEILDKSPAVAALLHITKWENSFKDLVSYPPDYFSWFQKNLQKPVGNKPAFFAQILPKPAEEPRLK